MFAFHTRPKTLKAVPYSHDITPSLTWDSLRKRYAMINAWVSSVSVKTISWNWVLKALLAWSFLSVLNYDSSTASRCQHMLVPHPQKSNLLACMQIKAVCPKMFIAALTLIEKKITMNK